MILTYGDMSKHRALHWYMVEMRSERTIEPTLHRLGKQLPMLFRDSAIEVFIPVATRDLNKFELSTGTYIFARSPHFGKLLRLKSITGVVGLVTHGDTGNPSRAIEIENAFVEDQIRQAEANFLSRASTIVEGSFVRILDGEQRDWCGVVTNVRDGFALVRIEIKSKVMLVETPVRNLLDKSHVPECLRVFYYGDMVEGLRAQGLETLVAEDLHYEDNSFAGEDGLDAPKPNRHSRQQTVTALVKRLIVTGTHDPRVIATETMSALRDGSLKKPRNLSIVHGIIKGRLVADYFHKINPEITSYRQVPELYGEQFHFSLQDLAGVDPSCGIPLTTEKKAARKSAKSAARRY